MGVPKADFLFILTPISATGGEQEGDVVDVSMHVQGTLHARVGQQRLGGGGSTVRHPLRTMAPQLHSS